MVPHRRAARPALSGVRSADRKRNAAAGESGGREKSMCSAGSWDQLLAALSETLPNVLLAFEPRVVMAAMHTTMIRASMTAYSTAVGPSSFFRKATSFRVIKVMGPTPVSGRRTGLRAGRHRREGNTGGRLGGGPPARLPGGPTQLAPPAGAAFWATLENVLFALLPRVVIAAMQTTMIRASMTAYSTAVGPSSFFTNSTNFLVS